MLTRGRTRAIFVLASFVLLANFGCGPVGDFARIVGVIDLIMVPVFFLAGVVAGLGQ